MKPWNWANPQALQAYRQALQWGHGGEAVELSGTATSAAGLPLLQWGHGGEAVELLPRSSQWPEIRSFNGATAVKPWNSFCVHRALSVNAMLQWGHGGEAVELSRRMSRRESSAPLQWGHGGEAVEFIVLEAPLTRYSSLQWGHGGEAVEFSMPQSESIAKLARFNGATAVKPWNYAQGVVDTASTGASMGPRR